MSMYNDNLLFAYIMVINAMKKKRTKWHKNNLNLINGTEQILIKL